MTRAARRRWAIPLAAALALVAVTVALLPFRPRLDRAHVVLVYLLVVLGGSAAAGRAAGIALAFGAFLAFNFFFLAPYHTLGVTAPLDWLVLAAFLATGIIAAHLLARAQRTAAEADQHAARAAALREADRLKDALLATVSHDIRTPLTTIRALADEIAATGDERALVIVEESDRLNRFVADLLDLSLLSAGGVPLAIALNAAEDVMGAALQRVRGMAGAHTIRASLDATEPVLVGRFDFAHTLRIIVNLLENALKYAPRDTPIDLSVHRDGARLVFDVADRGPGIAAADIGRVFEPLLRLRSAAPDVGGAGLGLAIARGLAEAQGGALTYAARDGGGSVFSLAVPAADLADAALA